MMLKMEAGQQRLESLTKSRIASLTKRSVLAKRAQRGAGAAEAAAPRADETSPTAVESAVTPIGAGAGGNVTEGGGLLEDGVAAAGAGAGTIDVCGAGVLAPQPIKKRKDGEVK